MRKKVFYTTYLEPSQLAKIYELSKRSRISMAVLSREAFDLLFNKYANLLGDKASIERGESEIKKKYGIS